MAGTYTLETATNGKIHFSLKAGNGQVILPSQMYESKAAAKAGIASVQSNCGNDARYERVVASNGKFYFRLKAGNHQVIGSSQMYASEAARDAGIESVKVNGGTATINDNT
ncbi:YegP family protein [Lysobacter sp. A289]